ncbi:MAG: sulfatase-like hydrolase/transferase, partial [Candidatus Binatia bacterium]
LAPQDMTAQIDRYDSEIRFMDHHFGRLLQGLRAVGRYDHALIVVVADHGESFGEHGLVSHGPWLYEELLHVPLLVRFPGGRDGGRVVDTPVSLVDLLPLIARETGIVLPSAVEGLPLGQRQLVVAEAFRSRVFIKVLGERFDRDLVAAVRWPWKLIVPDIGQVELYRLDEDPRELHNRRGEAIEQDIRRALDLTRAAFSPPAVPAVPKNVNPATMKRLKALGYLG